MNPNPITPQPLAAPVNNPTPAKKPIDYTKFRAYVLKKMPNLTSKQKTQLDEFVNKRSTEDLVRNGVLDIKDAAVKYPDIAAKLAAEGIKPKETLTAAEQTASTAKSDLSKAAENLYSFLDKNKEDVTGGFTNVLRNTREKFGLVSPASTAVRGLISKVGAAYAFGEGGKQFTKYEEDLIRGLLPMEDDDEQTIKDKAGLLIKALKGQSVDPNEVRKGKPLIQTAGEKAINFLLGSAIKTAKDTGTGIGLKQGGSQQSLEKVIQQADAIQAQAIQTKDPAQKKILLDQARSLIEEAQGASKGIQGQFTEDIEKPIWQRSLETGADVAGTAEIPSLVKGIAGIGKKGAGLLKGTNIAAAKESRDTLAKKVTEKVSGNKLTEPLKKVVEDDPFAQKLVDKILPSLEGKKFTAEELLRKIKVWGDAYSNAGALKDGTTARVYDALSRAAKKELGEVAPEVLKAHLDFGKAVGVSSFIKRLGRNIPFAAASTGVGVGVGTLLNKLSPKQ